ncbi:hypothetical protein IE53DRAFT_382963 [Violaceomyces palustris]|uniref:Uncharacterized protein n=1 Tax=Violaceomyces palustris TaxID=1673888 RepID=A0ACD0P8X4_9BASI|nr:hypothetical protein IE53DRAFT_382963 [Violaceomyces palustris]
MLLRSCMRSLGSAALSNLGSCTTSPTASTSARYFTTGSNTLGLRASPFIYQATAIPTPSASASSSTTTSSPTTLPPRETKSAVEGDVVDGAQTTLDGQASMTEEGGEGRETSEHDDVRTTMPQPVKYPYFVPRVGKLADSLPVYSDVRSGGNRCFTEIRKVQGSVEALREELASNLRFSSDFDNSPFLASKKAYKPKAGRKQKSDEPIRSSKVGTAGKIIIKGNRVKQVRQFLEQRGF